MTALHHRPHIDDIRSAYDGERSQSDIHSERSYRISRSGSSGKSSQTQPFGRSASLSRSLPRKQPYVNDTTVSASSRYFQDREPQESPRSSSATYASTSDEDEGEMQDDEDDREYQLPRYTPRSCESSAIAATPSEFSSLFPSSRRLAVHHDDSTLDGNMNLRLDTEVLLQGGKRGQMTLFHLRMHDLRNREFSLRRYCRDSGREVCHSEQKPRKSTVDTRPALQRSLSNALNGIRPKSESKMAASMSGLKRHDSGYGSMHSTEADNEARQRNADALAKSSQHQSDTIKLEFSNYAQIAVKRSRHHGARSYEFEYWGTHYEWRRLVRKTNGQKEASFRLTATGNDQALAHIVPTMLSNAQTAEERRKGGWIPPCSMWIADRSIIGAQKDIADVVIASGLIALVDDSIKCHFRSKNTKQLLIPVPKLQFGVEYVGPKQLFGEMFRRPSLTSRSGRRPSWATNSRRASSGTGTGNGTTAHRPPSGNVRQRSYEY